MGDVRAHARPGLATGVWSPYMPTSWMVAAAAPLPVPGPELPPVTGGRAGLPDPVPGLAALFAIAVNAPAAGRWVPGADPSAIRNAHYGNTRAQLAYALARGYNSVEGDVRMRDGQPVMQHDELGSHDLTFEQWAVLMARAGRHMRIDLKEREALEPVAATLERLGVPAGSVTFNVSARAPWSQGNQTIETIGALRARFPDAWITINLPMPFRPGVEIATSVARSVGGGKLGVAVMGGFASAQTIARLRSAFDVVNAWNEPRLGHLDIQSETARLRALGVNGMIDLRNIDDPLAID